MILENETALFPRSEMHHVVRRTYTGESSTHDHHVVRLPGILGMPECCAEDAVTHALVGRLNHVIGAH